MRLSGSRARLASMKGVVDDGVGEDVEVAAEDR